MYATGKDQRYPRLLALLLRWKKAENCFLKFSHCYSCITLRASIVGNSRTIVLVAATSEDLSSDNNDADGLNNLMALHVHKDMSDVLDAREIAREFVLREPRRCQVFGTDIVCHFINLILSVVFVQES